MSMHNRFISQRAMREMRFDVAVVNSIQKREGTNQTITHYRCSCGCTDCGGGTFRHRAIVTADEADKTLKERKRPTMQCPGCGSIVSNSKEMWERLGYL